MDAISSGTPSRPTGIIACNVEMKKGTMQIRYHAPSFRRLDLPSFQFLQTLRWKILTYEERQNIVTDNQRWGYCIACLQVIVTQIQH